MIRRESNSAVDRALPEWNYSASDNVKSALCSYRGKGISNAAVHFVDIPFRHAAVSEHLTGLRLAQNMAHGGWLDFYVIGTLEGQEDRAGVGRARSIFQFHAAHQPWLDAPVSKADICLIKAGNAEYKGLFRLLAQGHFVFDAAELAPLAAGKAPKALEDYALVILPDLQNLGDAEARRLEQYAAGGGRLLATGATATRNAIGDPRGGFGLEALGVKPGYETRTKRHADYLRIRPEDKARLGADRLKPFDLCFLFSNFLECEPAEATESLLRLIPAGMYGPPEKCYYGGESGTAGLFFSRRGKGACAFLPWGLGAMAQTLANPAHGALFEGAIEDLLGYRRRLIVEGSPLLEASWRASADGRFEWVALVNHSGQNGTAFLEPAEIHGTRLNLRPGGATSQARALRAGASLPFAQSADGWISLNLPPIGPFEWIVLEFGS